MIHRTLCDAPPIAEIPVIAQAQDLSTGPVLSHAPAQPMVAARFADPAASASSSDEDEQCAQAGIDAVAASLN